MRKALLFVCFVVLLCGISRAQDIVEVEFQRTYTSFQAGFVSIAVGLTVPIEHDVDIYRVLYTTEGSDMNQDTASGLFLIPQGVTRAMPLGCYQHGTTDGRHEVPSNLEGFYELGVLMASNGMAVVAPDFLGMGESRGFHPYVHAETEATASLDLLRALKTFLASQDKEANGQLFITGYSQGGHATMALHKYIEENAADEFQVTASLPMSGPYSLSGVMLDLAYGAIPFNFPSYIVYSSRGLREVYPDLYTDESEYFKEEFLPGINRFVTTGDSTGALNSYLVNGLQTNYGEVLPRLLFKDDVFDELNGNPDHPLNVALSRSDVYDWTPQAPVLMLYCEGDDQVPFRNTIIADSVMNARGAMDVSSREVSGGQTRDHVSCIIPAINEGFPWMLSFIVRTPTTEIAKIEGVSMYPNPANQELFIKSEHTLSHLLVTDLAGKTYYQAYEIQEEIHIDINQWASGMYLIHISTQDRTDSRKVIVQH